MDLAADEEWGAVLDEHPIFSRSGPSEGVSTDNANEQLSPKTIRHYRSVDPRQGVNLSGRRCTMLLKDADLIVAVGQELRMTSLGDARSVREGKKTFKTLHTPNVQFEIQQIALNPSGRLLAVAGAFQVAVVVLPRPGFMRLVPPTIDCRSLQIGQFYHAAGDSAPIAKVDWHPWGEAGSTLLVLTADGHLREYDTSVDPDEPQQVLSFAPQKKSTSFMAHDSAEREATSFTFGKGKADWGPLTVYAVMKSGDIYAVCPYLPKNSSIPTTYVHSLECFISAKVEYLEQSKDVSSLSLSTMYERQHLYIKHLIQQLPSGTMYPAVTRSVPVHPPAFGTTLLQGPFLLQPAPRMLDGSEGGDATDLTYVSFLDTEEEGEGDTERLGIMLVAYRDGKVDVCLDVDKVEALWESRQKKPQELPMLAVFETIDLGLVAEVGRIHPPALELLEGNHPVFHPDPMHDDMVYIYHAFGVHALNLSSTIKTLTVALHGHEDDPDARGISAELKKVGGVLVQPILSTFSVEKKCSNPIIGVTLPNDVYLNYCLLILTSAMRVVSFALTMRSSASALAVDAVAESGPQDLTQHIPAVKGFPAYVSLLGTEPYNAPSTVVKPQGLPSTPRLATPKRSSNEPFMLTPDVMRYLGQRTTQIEMQIHQTQIAYKEAESRSNLQKHEFIRQQEKTKELLDHLGFLRSKRLIDTANKLKSLQDKQKALLTRSDRVLQAFMQKASPELSEHETKWFEELKKMQADIAGSAPYDSNSLATRTSLLKREFDRLLPALKDVSSREGRQRQKTPEPTESLGITQAFELGQRLNKERARIEHVQQELLKLAGKVNADLGRPPKLSEN